MNNPYATPASDGADAQAAVSPVKPRRIWIFQALLALQLFGGVMATVSVLQMPEVVGLPLSALLRGLLRAIVGIVLVIGLLLALQRVGPKPSLVAPFLATLWWLFSVASHFLLGIPAEPDAIASLKAEDAPTIPPWLVAGVLHALLLWFVLSTWLHRRTRAYLARSPDGRL